MEVNTNKFNMVDGLQKPNGKDKEGIKISFCEGLVAQCMVHGTFIPVMIPKFNSTTNAYSSSFLLGLIYFRNHSYTK